MRLWPRSKPPAKSTAECEAEELQQRAENVARQVELFAQGLLDAARSLDEQRRGNRGHA